MLCFFVWQSSESSLLKLFATVARTSCFIFIPVLVAAALRKKSDLANFNILMRMGKYHIRMASESYMSHLILSHIFVGTLLTVVLIRKDYIEPSF